jgi:hypothetical protein
VLEKGQALAVQMAVATSALWQAVQQRKDLSATSRLLHLSRSDCYCMWNI